MKIALAFLSKVTLNKILASFLISLRWFSFVSIYFICISFYLISLPSFLLKHFVTLKDSISPAMTFKRTSLCRFTCKTKKKCLRGQGILPIQLTTSKTALYFSGIFMLNGKQLFTLFTFICFLKSKLIRCQKDDYYKSYVIK